MRLELSSHWLSAFNIFLLPRPKRLILITVLAAIAFAVGFYREINPIYSRISARKLELINLKEIMSTKAQHIKSMKKEMIVETQLLNSAELSANNSSNKTNELMVQDIKSLAMDNKLDVVLCENQYAARNGNLKIKMILAGSYNDFVKFMLKLFLNTPSVILQALSIKAEDHAGSLQYTLTLTSVDQLMRKNKIDSMNIETVRQTLRDFEKLKLNPQRIKRNPFKKKLNLLLQSEMNLESYKRFKLVGIADMGLTKTALLVAPSGHIYILTQGMKIGREQAHIAFISNASLTLIEHHQKYRLHLSKNIAEM